LVTGRFQEVIDDNAAAEGVRRVLVCSGKVYYELLAQREAVAKTREVAIVRLEQFYPWPGEMLHAALARYRAAREWVWVQEESQNMGGWTFVAPRLQELMKTPFQYVGRDASASPATGSHKVHDREQAELVAAAIGASLPHLVSAHAVEQTVALPLKQGAH
jgi:2-oxoglutarate dehydrogenase E1 component